MNHKNNQKYITTHLKIQNSLLELSKHKDTITISDICKHCNINRTTFYLHYEDIISLLNEIQLRMNKELLDSYIDTDENTKNPFSKESYFNFCKHIKDNQDFYRIFFKTNTTFPINEGFDDAWISIIKPIFISKGIIDEEIMLLRFIAFQAGFTNVLHKWVKDSCKQSLEDISNIIYECLKI